MCSSSRLRCSQSVVPSISEDMIGVSFKSYGERVVLERPTPDCVHASVQSRSSEGRSEGTVSTQRIHWRPGIKFRPI